MTEAQAMSRLEATRERLLTELRTGEARRENLFISQWKKTLAC